MNQAFGKINLALIVLGAVIGFTGLYLLSLRPVNNPISLNVAPFVIVAGYLVVIPAGLLLMGSGVNLSFHQPFAFVAVCLLVAFFSAAGGLTLIRTQLAGVHNESGSFKISPQPE